MRALQPWVPLIIAIVGIGGTLLASWFGYRNALRVERARWEHDDRIRQEQVERETRDRYNLERVRAYTDFVAAGLAVLAMDALSNSEWATANTTEALNANRSTILEFWRAYSATRILATPPVGSAAKNLFDTTMSQAIKTNAEDTQDLVNLTGTARGCFLKAVQAELVVPLDPPTPAPPMT